MTSGNPNGNQDQRPQRVGGDDPKVIIDDLEGRRFDSGPVASSEKLVQAYELKRFYTVKEAAAYLATSKWAIYKKIRRGLLRAYHDGIRVKIDRADLDGYVVSRMKPYAHEGAG